MNTMHVNTVTVPERRARDIVERSPAMLPSALEGSIANAIRDAVAAEREACAKLVDGWHITKGGYGNLAAAIRARSATS